MQHELVLPQALPEFEIEGRIGGCQGLHCRVEETQGVTAGCLGLVHRQVGLLEQIANLFALPVEEGDTYAAGAVVLIASQVVRLTQRHKYFVGDDEGPGLCHFSITPEVFQHHYKLVTPQSCHGIAEADTSAQASSDLLQ